MMKNVKRAYALVAAASVTIAAGVPVALAASADNQSPEEISKTLVVPDVPTPAISLIDDNRPTADVPQYVRKFAEGAAQSSPYKTTAAYAVRDRDWFVTKSDNGVCLAVPDGGACSPNEGVAKGQLAIVDLPAPPKGDVTPKGGASHVRGLVPDGVDLVVATTDSGDTVTAEVKDNIYEIEGKDLAQLTFSGPSAPAPIKLPHY